jgi:molybdate transport system substrate-binding protein
MRRWGAWLAAALSVVFAGQPARAGEKELTVWAARALALVIDEVGPEFTRETGYKVAVRSDLPANFLKSAQAGEHFDVLITGSVELDQWIRDGRIAATSRTPLSRSGIGVAIKAGSPKPDVSTVAAFKETLLKAKSVAYLRVGSGLYLEGLLKRLEIAAEVVPKSIRPEVDSVTVLVAEGKAEIGVVVATQILTTPGVELAGPLPPEIQSHISFVGGVSTKSAEAEAAAKLIAYLKRDRAVAIIKSQGMEPAP